MKIVKMKVSTLMMHAFFFVIIVFVISLLLYVKELLAYTNSSNLWVLDLVILYVFFSFGLYLFVHIRNIRRLKLTESTLKELILNNKDSWIWETDENFVFKSVDGYYKKILGKSSYEIIGKTPVDLLDNEDEKEFIRKFMRKLKSGEESLVDCEISFTNIFQKPQVTRFNITPIKSSKGKTIGFRGINKDISAKKNLENHLSYANYRIEETISAYNKVNVWEYELRTSLINIICYNYKYESLSFNPYEIKTLSDLVNASHPEDIVVLRDVNKYYINGGKEPRTIEFRVRSDDDKWLLFSATLFPTSFDQNGIPVKIIALNRYLPSRIVDDKFKAQQIFLDTILSNIPLGVFAKDPNDNWNYIVWNKYMRNLFKRDESEVVGKNDFVLFPEKTALSYLEDNEAFIKSCKVVDKKEVVIRLSDKKSITCLTTRIKIFDTSGAIDMILITLEDISRQKRMEMELRQAQKMDAVGRLAGGIAHNFNNLLQIIVGYSEMLSYSVNSTEKQYIDRIIDATQNAKDMTKQLLSFSRKESLKLSAIDINFLIHSFINMTGKIISKGIDIFFDEGKDIPTFIGDERLINHVLMNLFINAKDAMNGEGSIYVKTECVDFDKRWRVGSFFLNSGSYVLVAVSDTGSGIPSEIIDFIFDPFFTTKEEGKGTGLGLATVYGIVQDHHGAITVENGIEKGAVFKIYFPVLKEN